MANVTKEEILRQVHDQDIQFIRMQFTDIFGQLKNVAVTASQIQRAVSGEIMMDGSSIQGFVGVEESDQYLWPDLQTFAVLPWRPQYGKVARLICDVHSPGGEPFPGDPRNVLKKILARCAQMGYTFNVGPELEFFLFQTDEEGNPTTKTADQGGYFDLGPLDHGEGVRREICLSLEEMGIVVESSHHETAAGQHEIDMGYTEGLRAADNIMTFKLAAKTLAQRSGLHASFMPQPVQGAAGSGMHLNMSLFRKGKNAFYDPEAEGELSPLARQFIAGLLAHARGICAVTNPLVNSYKRLTPGHEAPCYTSWSAANRSALIRIPTPRVQGTRVELRNPDPSCNPYLAFAVCLAAGLDGIEKEMTPPPETVGNLYAMDRDKRERLSIRRLPESLEESLRALEADSVITDALGSHVTGQIMKSKRREWESYRTHVSRWELDRYLTTC